MGDLFGEPERIHIAGNSTLEKVCNHILDLTNLQPELLDGKTMKAIYNQVIIAVWKDNGVLWRCRYDYLADDRLIFLDLKTTGGSANPESFWRRILDGELR